MTEDEILESIEGHETRNAALLNGFKEKKIATNEPRHVEHHFWARNQRKAAELARELYKRDFLVLVICPVDDEDGSKWWNVEAELQQTIEQTISQKLVSELVRLAAKFEAIYDGWGTSV
jgi:regulator of RNase E activity RraB